MKIITFQTTQLETNSYLVINGSRAFVVDPGGDADKIALRAEENGALIEAVLLTHAHFDHIGGVSRLTMLCGEEIQAVEELKRQESRKRSRVCVFMHREDAEFINSYKNLAFSVDARVESFTPDVLLCGGETLNIAGLEVKVLHTPGHTPGGVCYLTENSLFTGDTLFSMSYGRTDFPGGDFKALKNSIVNKIFRLTGDLAVYPGHGDATTVLKEKTGNPILY